MSRTAPAGSLRRPGQAPPGPGLRRWLPGPDSAWWIGLVAAAFAAAELAFVSARLGLSWDEVVYVSQVSGHAPAAYFDPARARGVPLLVAPVALLTSSVTALRVYLSVASGAGLFGALMAWRRLRPAWVIALAGLCFAGLWVAQYYGPQAMPDLWVALAAVAAVGLFIRAAARMGARGSAAGSWPRAALAGVAGCVAAVALVRPGDAIFLAAPLAVSVIAVPAWRRWPLAAAVVAGLVAGGTEWVAEAYLRFGGPLARLRAAGAEQGGLGLHLAVWAELRSLNGPTLCRPCTVGWRHPELGLWWLALPGLAALGIFAARRAGRLATAVLPAACGCAVAVQYLFLIDYAAPRFLLPAYGLLALPVADGLAWLVTGVRADLRPLARLAVALCLVAQLAAQHVVLDHEVSGTVAFHDDYTRIAADLRALGVRPPCLIRGQQYIPIAFYAGCASAPGPPGADRAALLEYPGARPPRYARGWRRHRLPGTRVLRLIGYIRPR